MSRSKQIQGSCVAIRGGGVLLLGASGSGKSDLALRLIHDGEKLVADDIVLLSSNGNVLTASPPPSLAGLLEIRGAGIIRVPHISSVKLELAIELVDREEVERLPEPRQYDCLGHSVPLLSLHAFDVSTPAKIVAIVEALRAGGFVMELKKAQ